MLCINYCGQIFGNRQVVKNKCDVQDWLKLGLRVPSRTDKYVLTKCLNCGRIIPSMVKNLRLTPPKKCVFCSNIGNHSKVKTDTNTWAIYEDVAICNVVYNKAIVSFYIDKEDFQAVSKYIWRIAKKKQKYYVITGSYKKGTMQYLHSVVFGEQDPKYEIDHIDGNSLNNRRANLRQVDRQENVDNQRATRIDNQIGIRGVVYDKATKKYKVDFHYHGVRLYLKDWGSIEEAVWCRKTLEEYFGLPAIVNNPLADQYYTLSEESKEEIYQYVLNKILGNERLKSLHSNK